MESCPRIHRPRRPRETALFQLLESLFEPVELAWEERQPPAPSERVLGGSQLAPDLHLGGLGALFQPAPEPVRGPCLDHRRLARLGGRCGQELPGEPLLVAVDALGDPARESGSLFLEGARLLGLGRLFEGSYAVTHRPDLNPNDDVSRDAQRFLMVQPAGGPSPTKIHIVLNWFDELERLAPTER